MDWQIINNSLSKQFNFLSFKQAIQFIVKVAEYAEFVNHHPKIENTHTKVILSLTTHDAKNTVTDKDYELARLIDTIII